MAKPKFMPRKARKSSLQNLLEGMYSYRKLCKRLVPLVILLAFCYRHGLLDKLTSKVRMMHLGEPDKLMSFEQYQYKFPRKENPEMKLTEPTNRRLVFNANAVQIGRHNIAAMIGNSKFYVVQSPFKADRTLAEQQDAMGQFALFDHAKIRERLEANDTTSSDGWVSQKLETDNKFGLWFSRMTKGESYFEIPDFPLDKQPDPEKITHIDVDLRSCVPNLRDQKSCGACYAFSWVSLAEWHYCKQTGKPIDFSEQHIVDCGGKTKLEGCYAGKLTYVKAFTELFGFYLEENYPYKAKQGSCQKKPEKSIKVKINDFTRIKVDRKEWEEVLKEQPILLEVKLPSDITSYKRGVHPGTNCDPELGHGMLLVGHGRQEGVPYWLLKNSMGHKWGENGYLRLSRDAPMKDCFKNGFIAKFKIDSVDEDSYLDLYESIKFTPSVQPEDIVTERKGVSAWLSSK